MLAFVSFDEGNQSKHSYDYADSEEDVLSVFGGVLPYAMSDLVFTLLIDPCH